MPQIELGKTEDGRWISAGLNMMARHGFITGSTGMGKTAGIQMMIEQLCAAGVPCFISDVKGDLSGIANAIPTDDRIVTRRVEMERPTKFAKTEVRFWDLFGMKGLPIKISVQEMGYDMLARALGLNETQAGTLAIVFKRSEDRRSYNLTLDDLRGDLMECQDDREEVCRNYGNVTAASLNAIQRSILALESQGGAHLFGEPRFNVVDFIAYAENGTGIANLLHADKLMECPKLYGIFMLWLLTELFRALPEVGDLDKPKFCFFVDEAHTIFSDCPKPLMQQIERTVKLVRSRGVGVFFASQSPADIPDSVLAQMGMRIQYCLRAYSPKDQAMVKAAAAAFRPNRKVNVKEAVTSMGVGEALISVLDDAGVPTLVERCMMLPPAGQTGPISELERSTINGADPLRFRYGAPEESQRQVMDFQRRMLQARGLAHSEETGARVDWKAGDYAAFVPSYNPDPEAPARPGRDHYLKHLIIWAPITAAAIGLLTHIS